MKIFLAMWCCEGFECIQDVTQYDPDAWEKQNLINTLKDKKREKNPLGRQLFLMTMRAQLNSQRHYEIYAFNADDSITKADLREWADRDPQTLVNWIREHGSCQYNGRRTNLKPMIV